MNKPKSSLVPKVAAILLLAIVAGLSFFVLRPKHQASTLPSSAWDRRISITGDAGTQVRCWLNRKGVSEFRDLKTPATLEVPEEVGSVEIRQTDASGRLELEVQNQKGQAATVSLSAKDEFADLIITDDSLLWSKKHQTVAQLRIGH